MVGDACVTLGFLCVTVMRILNFGDQLQLKKHIQRGIHRFIHKLKFLCEKGNRAYFEKNQKNNCLTYNLFLKSLNLQRVNTFEKCLP